MSIFNNGDHVDRDRHSDQDVCSGHALESVLADGNRVGRTDSTLPVVGDTRAYDCGRHRDRHHPVIAFLVASPFEILDLTGPLSVFERAISCGESYYSIRTLSTRSGGIVETAGGMTIGNACKFSDYTGSIDTLIAIGGDGAVAPQSEELSKWLQERAPHIRRIASFHAGTFLLARAGMLDGCRVAAHWQWCDVLQSRYKRLKVERDPIFIKQGKFYTTAGGTAGIDLSLALVEEDLGHGVAAAIARILVLFVRRPGGQSQYSTLLAQQERIEDVRMRDLPVWVKGHLSRKLDVEDLANAAAMSPRTFIRQFKAQFNTTPARWVQSLRVEAAMQQLENRNTSLSKIARDTGFLDEQGLRRAFLQQIGVTPKEYREEFAELTLHMDYIEGGDSKACRYGSNNDIDDRKRAEEALRERELNLRQITETIPEMLWSSTPESSSVTPTLCSWQDSPCFCQGADCSCTSNACFVWRP
jgi:transcriptional regulator GlxA family with amidase domain